MRPGAWGTGYRRMGVQNLKFMDVGEFRPFVHMPAGIFTEDSKVEFIPLAILTVSQEYIEDRP